MTAELLKSQWLSDWRKFLDETEGLSERGRRMVRQAIQKTEDDLRTKHREGVPREAGYP